MEITERGRVIVGSLTEQGRVIANNLVEASLITLGAESGIPTPVLSGQFVTDHVALTWV